MELYFFYEKGGLEKLFLKFKGLIFKYLENNISIEEEHKSLARNYLFIKFFGINLDNKNKNNLKCEAIDFDKLIEKTDYFKNLAKEYYDNEEDKKFLYKCVVTFYHKKNRMDVINKILAFEKENNFNKFDTVNILHPITGVKLFKNDN